MSVAPLGAATREARERLAALAGRYHGQGWLFGTSGNLSMRIGDRVVITASGRDKGALAADRDFVEVSLDGALLAAPEGARASAETSIHLAVYARVPAAAAVLHVHTIASTLARPPGGLPGEIVFCDLEMLKGYGLWAPDAVARLPVFANHAHVPAIAAELGAHLETPREVPAALIAGHGLTAWGDSLDAAHRHVEVTEFLCRVHLAREAGPAAAGG